MFTEPQHFSRIVENVIRKRLEELRENMIQGSDKMPVLDPYFRDNTYLDGNDIGLPR